ncbi:MAG: NUDIX hydrolase [Floccifex sp.]
MDKKVFEGDLFQVIHKFQHEEFSVSGKKVLKDLKYEMVRRPPGVRALIVKSDKILLSKEFRYELHDWDYRLPGGKVYDSNEQFNLSMKNNSITVDVENALIKEIREEVNINVIDYELLHISKSGLTVEWDLYYFLIRRFEELQDGSIQKSEYEYINRCWVDFDTALDLCLNRKVSEGRSAFEIIRHVLMKEGDG